MMGFAKGLYKELSQSGLFIFRKPRQGFFAMVENRQVTAGEVLHLFVKVAWKSGGSNQCRFLDEWFVKDGRLFNSADRPIVKRGSSEMRKDQN